MITVLHLKSSILYRVLKGIKFTLERLSIVSFRAVRWLETATPSISASTSAFRSKPVSLLWPRETDLDARWERNRGQKRVYTLNLNDLQSVGEFVEDFLTFWKNRGHLWEEQRGFWTGRLSLPLAPLPRTDVYYLTDALLCSSKSHKQITRLANIPAKWLVLFCFMAALCSIFCSVWKHLPNLNSEEVLVTTFTNANLCLVRWAHPCLNILLSPWL